MSLTGEAGLKMLVRMYNVYKYIFEFISRFQSTKTKDQIPVVQRKNSMERVRSGVRTRIEKAYEKEKFSEDVHRLHLQHLSRKVLENTNQTSRGGNKIPEQKTEGDSATQAGEENTSSAMERGG